jgi:co-chaperonin GroES (HSP10)
MNHNEYRTVDGRVFRLVSNDILVKVDRPAEKTAGGIHIPDTVGDRGAAGLNATGTILAFGFLDVGGKKGKPHKRIPLPDLYVGQKCVFVRYYSEQESNKQIQTRIEEDVIRLKPLAIQVVYDPEDHDRVLR